MSQFIDFLVGTFANKVQAQSHPTRYAHIRVSHRLIGENRIYGEQAYNYLLNRPYRQFVIDVVEENEEEKNGTVFPRADGKVDLNPQLGYISSVEQKRESLEKLFKENTKE